MPRSHLSGPEIPPKPECAWVSMNERLFGSELVGGFFVAPRPESLPVNWTEIFGRDAPKALEIGFNRGVFLRSVAERWPDHDVIGVEIRRKFCWHLVNEVGDAGAPKNLRLIWADAKNVVPAVFGNGSLSHLFVTFPDPWWKKRHAKRRLVDEDFAANIAPLLRPGGRIWVKTDVPAIAEEIAHSLSLCPELTPPEPFAQDDLPLTYREKRCIAQGLPITRFFVTHR